MLELFVRRHTPGGGAPGRRPPPRLLARTLSVTFAMVALILAGVFLVLMLDVRRRARTEVIDILEASRVAFEAVETRHGAELGLFARALAGNPTFAAALQKYRNQMGSFSQAEIRQSLGWIERELAGIAKVLDADAAVVLADDGTAIATAGPRRAEWRVAAQDARRLASRDPTPVVRFVHGQGATYRVRRAALAVPGQPLTTLCIADRLDHRYAARLSESTRAGTVVTSNGTVVAASFTDDDARALTTAWTPGVVVHGQGEFDLRGERYVIRALFAAEDTAVYGVASLGTRISKATVSAARTLSLVAAGSLLLAWLGSYILALRLSAPIDRISGALSRAVESDGRHLRLAPDGSSRELDTMAQAFNQLMVSLARSEDATEAAYLSAIRALVTALDARDSYTAGHSARVSDLSVALAEWMHLDGAAVEVVRLGALLHDIGKIGIGDAVLNKAGHLAAAEVTAIRAHPLVGVRILAPVAFLTPYLPVVELHHERPDGQGYPHGLRGDAIPLQARIVHVADAFDAMTSARPYRPARPVADALEEIMRHRGTQFDPVVVDALLDLVQRERQQGLDAGASGVAEVA